MENKQMICKHKYVLLDNVIASEPFEDVENLQKYLGDEYRFYCEKCLDVKKVVVRNILSSHYAIVFDPLEKKKEKKRNVFQVGISELNILKNQIKF